MMGLESPPTPPPHKHPVSPVLGTQGEVSPLQPAGGSRQDPTGLPASRAPGSKLFGPRLVYDDLYPAWSAMICYGARADRDAFLPWSCAGVCLSLGSVCNHQGAPATCHACTRARTPTEEAPPALSPRTPAQPALDPSPSQLVAPRTHLCTVRTSHAARKRCVRSTQGRPTPTRPRLSPRPGSLLGRRGHKRHNQAREREEEGFCLQQVTRPRDPAQSRVSPNSKPGEGFTRGANAHRGACAQGLRHGTAAKVWRRQSPGRGHEAGLGQLRRDLGAQGD